MMNFAGSTKYDNVVFTDAQGVVRMSAVKNVHHVDAIARGIIEKAGFGKRFTHSLGHSFGLQIHESVRLAKGQDRPLEADMVVTVEPGIYIPGKWGMRLEDIVVATSSGPDSMNVANHNLIVVEA